MSLQTQADELQQKTAGFMSGTTKFIKNVAGRGADLAKQNEALSNARTGYINSRSSMKTMANNLNDSVAKQETIGKNMYDINQRSNSLLRTQARMESKGYQGPASWIKGKVKTVDINATRKSLATDMSNANKAMDAEKLNQDKYRELYDKASQDKAFYRTNAKNIKGNIQDINNDVSKARKRLAIGVGALGLAGTGAYAATRPQNQGYQQPYYQPQQYQPTQYRQMPYKTAGFIDSSVNSVRQESFVEKIAKFVEDYDYPEDYMEQMATPNEKPNNMLYLGAGALGGTVGGLLGGAYGSIFNKAGKGALIGAGLLGGAALYKAHSVNADRKVWSNNPELFKKHLQDEWDNDALPYFRSQEKEYADAVKNNIMHSNRLSFDEVAGGIGTAAHLGSAVSHHNKNEKSDRNFDATMGALHAASTYNAYQKRQDNKSYRDKYLSLTPAQRTALDHEIRTAWRNLSAGEREDEGFRVYEGEPSAFIHALNRY